MNATLNSVAVSLVYLGGASLVFIFGSSYFNLFRTNRSWLFKLTLIVASGVAAWLLIRSHYNPAYGLLALAFLCASTASFAGAAAAHLLHRRLKLNREDVRAMGLAKGLEALVVAASILALIGVSGTPLRSFYLTAGSLGLGLAIGGSGFLLFAIGAWLQGRQLGITARTYRRLLPWVLLFVFANGFMEELWFRALFLGPLSTLAGPIAAVIVTAAVFAFSHIGATYMKREERIRFLVILFPLGLIWAASFHFTGSIIAATLFHAGADLMAINGFVAAYHGSEEGLAST